MSLRLQIAGLFLLPVAILGGLYALGLSIPVPQMGRDYVLRILFPEESESLELPEIQGPLDASRPLVVIDAGHGGPDPGASGSGYVEKRLVLSYATALRDRLLAGGGVRVAMTRSDDTFVVLGERVAIAQALGADLFVSIHADSAENTGASGATIYTLADEASDAVAARFAVRENAASRINGVDLDATEGDVDDILFDLSQRRVERESKAFARLVVREGEGRIAFHPRPLREADLAVLKSPDIPAILFESGYISNPEDAERLAASDTRSSFAIALARAIRIHFARESAATN